MAASSSLLTSKLESTTVLSAEQIATFGGEAKLLRAYAYFTLVQLFGGVPLRTEPLVGLDDLQIERASETRVYDLIIQDLKDAEAGLQPSSSQVGRANSYIAKALLARVYLTSVGNPMNITANYALAVKKAEEVIAGPYKLLEDISDVFKTHHIPLNLFGIFNIKLVLPVMTSTITPLQHQMSLHYCCLLNAFTAYPQTALCPFFMVANSIFYT
ncbi:RagB/SusD family nutrient uptake outer membrane protein [bacterium]|nr:RagB/SusD family nutrient uptake outer membrane protein [bacterium]